VYVVRWKGLAVLLGDDQSLSRFGIEIFTVRNFLLSRPGSQ
jgi:hypothetical protein